MARDPRTPDKHNHISGKSSHNQEQIDIKDSFRNMEH
jgi:hypothetical protein